MASSQYIRSKLWDESLTPPPVHLAHRAMFGTCHGLIWGRPVTYPASSERWPGLSCKCVWPYQAINRVAACRANDDPSNLLQCSSASVVAQVLVVSGPSLTLFNTCGVVCLCNDCTREALIRSLHQGQFGECREARTPIMS